MKSKVVPMPTQYTMKSNGRIKVKLHMSLTFIPDAGDDQFYSSATFSLVHTRHKAQWTPKSV
jgi:hypothetical protein